MLSKSALEQVRAEVLNAVKFGQNRLNLIVKITNHDDRVVDNALQFLRNKGRIRFSGVRGWEFVK